MHKVEEQTEPIVFKEGANYSWLENDQIAITGKEFEFAHNTLAQVFEGKLNDAQMYAGLYQLFQITFNILKRSVESGIIKEVPKQD